jgi:hypothetical protein
MCCCTQYTFKVFKVVVLVQRKWSNVLGNKIVLQPFRWVPRRNQTALLHFVLITVKTRMEKYIAHGLMYNRPSLVHTGHTQRNGEVSKPDKEFIFHPTQAQHTLSAEGTVKVPHELQQFASHAYCGATGPVSKMASQR